MKQGIAVGGLVSLVALVLAVEAAASTYEGRIKDAPGSTFEFTVERVNGNKTVTEMAWTEAPLTCEGEPAEASDGSSGFESGGRVHQDGSFKALAESLSTQNRIRGELKQGGKAAGIFSTAFGLNTMTACYTGKLYWVAKR